MRGGDKRGPESVLASTAATSCPIYVDGVAMSTAAAIAACDAATARTGTLAPQRQRSVARCIIASCCRRSALSRRLSACVTKRVCVFVCVSCAVVVAHRLRRKGLTHVCVCGCVCARALGVSPLLF